MLRLRITVGIGIPDRIGDHHRKLFLVASSNPTVSGIDLERLKMLLHRTVGMFLHPAVKRGVDRQPVPVDVESVFVRLYQELLADPFDEMRRDARPQMLVLRRNSSPALRISSCS